MTKRFVAFLAVTALSYTCVAGNRLPAPVAIFYSFESAPDPTVLPEMQKEFARILEPTGFSVLWQEAASGQQAEFTDLYIVRFRGLCSTGARGRESDLSRGERSLGETSVSNGRVLPFAEVRCDSIRRYLAGGSSGQMARAMARVTAHEMYHMVTGFASHCERGLAQAEFSLRDLIAPGFAFGPKETETLRARVTARSPHERL